MFRITVFSIALTVAVAPSATLLCRAWCHPGETATDACHHDERTPLAGATGGGSCNEVALDTSTFIREEGSRAAAGSDPGPAVAVLPYRLGPLPSEALTVARERRWPLEQRPLETALRL